MICTDMQAGAHAAAVSLFAACSQHGTDAGLRDFAARTLPALEEHKAQIEGIVAMR